MTDEFDFHAFNAGVIEEFRATGGRVGGPFEGAPMVLITHRGAKSGKEYTTPLVHTRDGDAVVIIASKGGAPEDPQWYRNLRVNPDVTVEVGTERGHMAHLAAGRDPRLAIQMHMGIRYVQRGGQTLRTAIAVAHAEQIDHDRCRRTQRG